MSMLMSLLHRGLTFALALSLVSQMAYAGDAGEGAFVVNPGSLRTRMIRDDISVLSTLNSVYQAKEQVNIARGNLLPSLNIGATLAGLSGGPTFAITAVSFLLPFLFPSNWYNLDASENQLVAYGYAFHLVELNEYASGYALYSSIIADQALKSIYQRQYVNLVQIRDLVAQQVQVGIATQTDLEQAEAKVALSNAQVAQIAGLLAQEKAAVRKMLALPLIREIVFEDTHPSPLGIESRSPQTVLDIVGSQSPEEMQVAYLIKAAESSTWSKAWGFLTGASLNAQSNGPNQSVSFDNLTVTGTAGIGFSYMPVVRLSNLNVEQLKLRRREIRLELARVIEASLVSLGFANLQLSSSRVAEAHFEQALQGQMQMYRQGLTDLLHVIDAENSVTTASINRLRAQLDVDHQRVNLMRVLRADQFSAIPNCQLKNIASGGEGWFSDLFDGNQSKVSVDQACRAKRRPAKK